MGSLGTVQRRNGWEEVSMEISEFVEKILLKPVSQNLVHFPENSTEILFLLICISFFHFYYFNLAGKEFSKNFLEKFTYGCYRKHQKIIITTVLT